MAAMTQAAALWRGLSMAVGEPTVYQAGVTHYRTIGWVEAWRPPIRAEQQGVPSSHWC